MSLWTADQLHQVNAARAPRGTVEVTVFPGDPPLRVRVAPVEALLLDGMLNANPLLPAAYEAEQGAPPPPAEGEAAARRQASAFGKNAQTMLHYYDNLFSVAVIDPPYYGRHTYAATGVPPADGLNIYYFQNNWAVMGELHKVIQGDTSALEAFRAAAARDPLASAGETARETVERTAGPAPPAPAPLVAGRSPRGARPARGPASAERGGAAARQRAAG
jgi:hypothetical protein